jgi:hypothetical protein
VDIDRPPEVNAMLTTATSEVMRLMSTMVRRVDANLAESAVRNAESSVLAAHLRRLDEMRTLSDLHALQGLTPDPDAETIPDHLVSAIPGHLVTATGHLVTAAG